jgi:hypothetical protein
MIDIVTEWDAIQQKWNGLQNFALSREIFPYTFRFPPLDEIVDAVRRDEKTQITRGKYADRLDVGDVAADYRALPIEEAVSAPVQLTHYELDRFMGPSQIFHGLDDVRRGWERSLAERDFTWTRIYPIFFLSGPGRHTGYHIDQSHVLAWQIVGTKRFVWLKDPERWCPPEVRKSLFDSTKIVRPTELAPDDETGVDMRSGDVLWNTVLTPHWVFATEETAFSINFAHWGLRHRGELAPLGREVEQIRRDREARRTR